MSWSDSAPQERLEANLKTPYPADESVWSGLLAALANEFDEIEAVREEVLAAKFVTSADGAALDRLASIFEVERRTGESDAKFRIRVQTALRSQLSSGTVGEIRETISVLLDTDLSSIVLREPYDVEPARVDVGVFESELDQRSIAPDEFAQYTESLTAGGVGVETFGLGTFQYVSMGDDPTNQGAERGYADLENPNTGGTYASVDLE